MNGQYPFTLFMTFTFFIFYRVQAGSDCGFATFGKLPTVHPDIAWAKLGAMVEGANIAADKIKG